MIRKINLNIFIGATLFAGLLLIPSLFAAFVEDEGTLKPDDAFLNIFAQVFRILRFPTHTLLAPILEFGGPITFLGGLLFNCLFYGLVAERIASLIIKSKEQ